MLNLEKVFAYHSNELTAGQKNILRKNLRSWYLDVILDVEIPAERTGNLKKYATKGIELGHMVGRSNDMHDFLFHYFMVVYYYYQDNESQMDNWTRKLNEVRNNFTESTSLRDELSTWANGNIRTMKRSISSSSVSYSIDLGKLVSSFSSSGSSSPSISGSSSGGYGSNSSGSGVSVSTKGSYKFIKTESFDNRTEYIYKCANGDYFTIKKFKESGQIYGPGMAGSKYSSISEAAEAYGASSCH